MTRDHDAGDTEPLYAALARCLPLQTGNYHDEARSREVESILEFVSSTARFTSPLTLGAGSDSTQFKLEGECSGRRFTATAWADLVSGILVRAETDDADQATEDGVADSLIGPLLTEVRADQFTAPPAPKEFKIRFTSKSAAPPPAAA